MKRWIDVILAYFGYVKINKCVIELVLQQKGLIEVLQYTNESDLFEIEEYFTKFESMKLTESRVKRVKKQKEAFDLLLKQQNCLISYIKIGRTITQDK
jgi:hypothetical protein